MANNQKEESCISECTYDLRCRYALFRPNDDGQSCWEEAHRLKEVLELRDIRTYCWLNRIFVIPTKNVIRIVVLWLDTKVDLEVQVFLDLGSRT